MRIISKFHDYYDSALGYGGDSQLPLYLLSTEEVFIQQNQKDDLYWANSTSRGFSRNIFGVPKYDLKDKMLSVSFIEKNLVVFCGDVVPFIVVATRHRKTFQTVREYIYDYDSFVELAGDSPRSKEWLTQSHNPSLAEDFLIRHRVPVILVPIYDSSLGPRIIKSPPLKDVKFFKHMDAFGVFQRIEMFLGNNLASQNDPPVPVGSDVDIAMSKGYDKYSFRKDSPGKKRKRKKNA